VVITARGTDSILTYQVAANGTFGTTRAIASQGPDTVMFTTPEAWSVGLPGTAASKDAASCWPRGAPTGAFRLLPRGQLPSEAGPTGATTPATGG
jgi:hypothetical protein